MSRRRLSLRAQEEINRLRRRDGSLRPADVVKAATDPESALHRYFEWDDTEAARKYRLQQAEGLIRLVVVQVVTGKRVVAIPAYIQDTRPKVGQRYILTTRIQNNPEQAKIALSRELKGVVGWLERCERLAQAFNLTEELIEIRERVEVIQELLQAA